MPLGVCCHSDDDQECVNVASDIQVSLLQVCINVYGIIRFMSPSWQAPLLYIVLQILFNQRNPHTIDTIYSHLKYVWHAQYNVQVYDTHEKYWCNNILIFLIWLCTWKINTWKLCTTTTTKNYNIVIDILMMDMHTFLP